MARRATIYEIVPNQLFNLFFNFEFGFPFFSESMEEKDTLVYIVPLSTWPV